MNLLRREALVIVPLGRHQALHDVPAGKVRTRRVTNLALPHQRVERLHHFLDGRQPIPFMQIIDVDAVALQALEAGLALLDDVKARQALLVRPLTHGKAHLCADENLVRAVLEDAANCFLRLAGGISVRRIEEVDAAFDRNIDEPRGLLQSQAANGAEEAFGCEVHGAKRK